MDWKPFEVLEVNQFEAPVCSIVTCTVKNDRLIDIGQQVLRTEKKEMGCSYQTDGPMKKAGPPGKREFVYKRKRILER